MWGRGRATPVPTCDAHTHVWNWRPAVRVAREPGHASGSGSTSLPVGGRWLTAASGLARRQPPGLGVGHTGPDDLVLASPSMEALPSAMLVTVTPVTRLSKPQNEIETSSSVSALPVVVGALPWQTLNPSRRGASSREAWAAEGTRYSRCGAPIPGTAGSTTFPGASVPPRTSRRRVGGAPPGPAVPARSEETPRT